MYLLLYYWISKNISVITCIFLYITGYQKIISVITCKVILQGLLYSTQNLFPSKWQLFISKQEVISNCLTGHSRGDVNQMWIQNIWFLHPLCHYSRLRTQTKMKRFGLILLCFKRWETQVQTFGSREGQIFRF